jgi:hypothetical protein
MPVCLEQRPLLRPVDGEHTVACWADIKEAVASHAS